MEYEKKQLNEFIKFIASRATDSEQAKNAILEKAPLGGDIVEAVKEVTKEKPWLFKDDVLKGFNGSRVEIL